MASQKNLLSAVATKLATDATLVSLLGHSGGDPRIGRPKPQTAAKSPYLGISTISETPTGVYAPQHKRYIMEWQVTALSDVSALQISDRIETILDTAYTTNAAYWDPSDESIRVDNVHLRTRGRPVFDEKTDTWSVRITVQIMANPYIGCS